MHSTPENSSPGRAGFLPRIVLPVVLLVAGGLIAYWLFVSGPKTAPRPPAPAETLVEVRPVVFGPGRAVVEAMGTVLAAREVTLRAPVGGEVIEVSGNLVPGGLFAHGETMLVVEPADYLLMVRQLEGEVAEAEAALKMEQGFQDVARREYELLGEQLKGEDLDLVLRKPQLDTARARLDAARSRLARARLDLERTVVRAPFAGVVQKREADLGARVAANAALVTLLGTDVYWVEVVVPVQQLQWLAIPGNPGEGGSLARIYDPAAWGEAVSRTGRVVRLAADLEEQGRLARLFVAVEDPLALGAEHRGKPRLLAGSYVRVELEGKKFASVASLERFLLKDGDRVWIMDAENRLDVRRVEIAFRQRDRVLVSGGIRAGELLVVSDLAAPVPGLPLRVKGAAGKPGEER